MKIRVMTYNIAGGRDHNNIPERNVNPAAAAAVISEYAPDIVGLNEVDFFNPRSGNIDLAREIGIRSGYASFFAKACVLGWKPSNTGEYGNALLYRVPMVSSEAIVVPDPEDKTEPVYYETRGILRSVLLFGGREVEVVVTHFGLAKTERAETMKLLKGIIAERTRPLILMGDFNVRPNSDEIADLFASLKDTFAVYEDKGARTFPSRFDIPNLEDSSKNEGKGIKIDYIFVSEEFKVEKVIIPEALASDHLPYVADIEL